MDVGAFSATDRCSDWEIFWIVAMSSTFSALATFALSPARVFSTSSDSDCAPTVRTVFKIPESERSTLDGACDTVLARFLITAS